MSKGAFKELTRASLVKFSRLIKDIPFSEKTEVKKSLLERELVLGAF